MAGSGRTSADRRAGRSAPVSEDAPNLNGMTELKQRPGDQPLPTPNQHADIQSQVIADIKERRQVGISRYGTALQPFNGRDALRDLYEELLDGAMYVRQAMVERDAAVQAALAQPRQRLGDLIAEIDKHIEAIRKSDDPASEMELTRLANHQSGLRRAAEMLAPARA